MTDTIGQGSGSAGQGVPPSFELTYAPFFFGVIFNVLLFGVFIVQVHSYFRLYKTDYAWVRYLIYYLAIMETVNTVCDVGLIYEPLVKLHGDTSSGKAPTLLAADPIVTTLISTPVQLFMAWRIRLVTKSNLLSGIVSLLAFLSLIGGVSASIVVAQHPLFAQFHLAEGPLTLWLTSTAFADLFITAFLVNFLWVNKTGFQTQADSVTDKIIFMTVQTGMLTSFAAIADVSIFLLVPDTTLMFIWDLTLGKMYSISLISTLNARADWNNLLSAMPPPGEKKDRNAIIKVRRATDIQGLQLYIPGQFEIGTNGSPRKRTPRAEWIPPPLPFAATRNHNKSVSSDSESARRTAAWAMATGR